MNHLEGEMGEGMRIPSVLRLSFYIFDPDNQTPNANHSYRSILLFAEQSVNKQH